MNIDVQELKDLLMHLCTALVNAPEAVTITPEERDFAIVLKVTCNQGDMGKLIGRGGRRAQAIRTILKAKASQLGTRVIVDFVD